MTRAVRERHVGASRTHWGWGGGVAAVHLVERTLQNSLENLVQLGYDWKGMWNHPENTGQCRLTPESWLWVLFHQRLTVAQ